MNLFEEINFFKETDANIFSNLFNIIKCHQFF